VAILFLLIPLSLLALGPIYQTLASRRDAKKYPPPGKVVTVPHGNLALHLYCLGQGKPTVVLEAAQGDSSLDWRGVQEAVAEFTRVCAYDRPGLGWSSPAAKVLTADQIAENLRQALEAAGERGPYVLVGHSIGGVYVRAFAQKYPEDVAGLVLVDSAHENQQQRMPAATMKELQVIKRLASVLRVLAPFGIPRALKLADRLQGEYFAADIRAEAMARMYQTHFFRSLLNEVKAVEVSTSQTDPPATLNEVPLIVLSRGSLNPGLPDEEFEWQKQCWNALQRELTMLSSNSRQIVAEKSGHYIHHDQPELVVDAIRLLVEEI
jgi:pimeloyl-ACP methyl ester carboxylesterase